jgi:hypothetical protein
VTAVKPGPDPPLVVVVPGVVGAILERAVELPVGKGLLATHRVEHRLHRISNNIWVRRL